MHWTRPPRSSSDTFLPFVQCKNLPKKTRPNQWENFWIKAISIPYSLLNFDEYVGYVFERPWNIISFNGSVPRSSPWTKLEQDKPRQILQWYLETDPFFILIFWFETIRPVKVELERGRADAFSIIPFSTLVCPLTMQVLLIRLWSGGKCNSHSWTIPPESMDQVSGPWAFLDRFACITRLDWPM